MIGRGETKVGGPLAAVVVSCCLGLAGAAPRAQSTAAVPAEAITAMLEELDTLFARGDVASYLDRFAPDNAGAHAVLQRELERVCSAGVELRRTSKVVGTPRVIGERTVVRVHHEVTFPAPGEPGGASRRSFAEDVLLAVRRMPDGRVVPTFRVEVPCEFACLPRELFHCPPCNFEIGGTAGWLCVPMRGDRSQSIETASFYLIGTDVACDVSVRVDPAEPPAPTVARALGEAMHTLDPKSRPGLATTWLPAAHAETPPMGFGGARLEVRLPDDFGGAGGVAILHVLTFGGLQHLLLVRGSARAVHEHSQHVQALLDSYRLLENDRDQVMAAASALRHHTGGSLKKGSYHNDRYRLDMVGPSDWAAQQRCGGSAFRVVWSSPNGSRLWLTGYGLPAGMDRWCRKTADRWLQQLLRSAGLEPDADGAKDWHEEQGCSAAVRCLTCRPPAQAKPDSPHRRSIRVQLWDDLLVVADGHATTARDEEALKVAVASLRRR